MIYSSQKQVGFTLLELLLVIFLLGVLAMTTFAVVQEGDDQQRFDATKTYYQLIKKAIVGDPTLTLNGETDVSGFVADMGRLPNCLRELVEQRDCNGIALPTWSQDADSQVWAGWRGPYLQGIPESGIGLAFRDGWKNQGAATANGNNNPDISNYGWLFGIGAANGVACGAATVTQNEPNTLYLQSCGSDGQVSDVATGSYPDDYPYLSPTAYLPLVVAADYSVSMGSTFDNLFLELINNAGVTIEDNVELRLSINSPNCFQQNPLNCNAGYVSDAFKLNEFVSKKITEYNIKAGSQVVFPSGATVTGNSVSTSSGNVILPNGNNVAVECSPTCTVSLSQTVTPDTVNPNRVTAPAGGLNITFIATNLKAIYSQELSRDWFAVLQVPETATVSTNTVNFDDVTLTLNHPVKKIGRRIVIEPSDTNNTTIQVSESVELKGTVIVDATNSPLFGVPLGSTLSGNTITLANELRLTAGNRSVTLICSDGTGSPGKAFDGNCDTDDDAEFVATFFKIKPRTTINPPSVLRWKLQ